MSRELARREYHKKIERKRRDRTRCARAAAAAARLGLGFSARSPDFRALVLARGSDRDGPPGRAVGTPLRPCAAHLPRRRRLGLGTRRAGAFSGQPASKIVWLVIVWFVVSVSIYHAL